jgi:hypothetical protein
MVGLMCDVPANLTGSTHLVTDDLAGSLVDLLTVRPTGCRGYCAIYSPLCTGMIHYCKRKERIQNSNSIVIIGFVLKESHCFRNLSRTFVDSSTISLLSFYTIYPPCIVHSIPCLFVRSCCHECVTTMSSEPSGTERAT